MRRRGNALASVLMLSVLAMLAAFTLASAATWNLQVAYRVENQSIALELAESALQQTLAELMNNPEFGLNKETIKVDQLADLPPGAEAVVTFDPAQAFYSTNNARGDRNQGWQSRPVPLGRVHVLARSRCRGVERKVEIMVYAPRFPRAIASDSDIELRGALVASLNKLTDVLSPSGQLQLSESVLRRGDVVSNHETTLSQASRVKGSAQAHLQVIRQDTSTVEGEVLAPYERSALPDVNIATYDPKSDPDTLYEPRPAGVHPALDLTGITRFDTGSVRISGDLKLDNAIMYVDGDLAVTGHITGVGAIIVNGKTEVGGSVHLTSNDNLALLSSGDIRLRGDGKASSFFVGLVYSRGAVSADDITIVGSLLAKGRVYVSRSNVFALSTAELKTLFRKEGLAFPGQIKSELGLEAGQMPEFQKDKDYAATRLGEHTVAETMAITTFNSFPYMLPCVLEIEKKGGGFFYSCHYLHRKQKQRVVIGPLTDRELFISRVTTRLANNEKAANLSLLIAQVYAAWCVDFSRNFRATVMRAEAAEMAKPNQPQIGNFNLAPNRFLSEGEQLRVVYRREL